MSLFWGVGGLDRKKILLKCLYSPWVRKYTPALQHHTVWNAGCTVLPSDGIRLCYTWDFSLLMAITPVDVTSSPGTASRVILSILTPVITETQNPTHSGLVCPSACVPIRRSSDLNRRET